MIPEEIATILTTARVVAVLGAHSDPSRPAFYVPDYLAAHGYVIHPVNATLVGETLWGKAVRATLPEVGVAVDVVDVFRRSDALPAHVEEILAMRPLPKVVWFQSGIRNDAVAKRLEAEGITVVQSRCMLADHQSM